jgi:hypothetical protein
MRLLRWILVSLRLDRRGRSGGYGPEVLFAGWVELPAAFRELRQQTAVSRKPSLI